MLHAKLAEELEDPGHNPTLNPTAREARIAIREPVLGGERAYVTLRLVELLDLNDALTISVREKWQRVCVSLAHKLVFG